MVYLDTIQDNMPTTEKALSYYSTQSIAEEAVLPTDETHDQLPTKETLEDNVDNFKMKCDSDNVASYLYICSYIKLYL